MITIRPGSHTHRLLIFLSYTGEIPVSAVKLLGSENTWRLLIQKLSQPQEFRFADGTDRFSCRMLNISGKGRLKTMRLSRTAIPILARLDTLAYTYYERTFLQHNFSGTDTHIERHHRVAEAAVMCDAAGIETRPYCLPPLQNQQICRIVPSHPSFYVSRELKGVGEGEENKTNFSRIVGAIFYPGGCHALFNTRKTCMKWYGRGENKVHDNLEKIARWNAGVDSVPSAILLGADYKIALRTMKEACANRKLDLRFDAIYDHAAG